MRCPILVIDYLNTPILFPFLGNFRKQHEQLRTVIVRVLRPSGSASADGLMDADDQSAIEEVNLAYEDAKQADVLDLTESGLKHWEAAKRRLVFID